MTPTVPAFFERGEQGLCISPALMQVQTICESSCSEYKVSLAVFKAYFKCDICSAFFHRNFGHYFAI